MRSSSRSFARTGPSHSASSAVRLSAIASAVASRFSRSTSTMSQCVQPSERMASRRPLPPMTLPVAGLDDERLDLLEAPQAVADGGQVALVVRAGVRGVEVERVQGDAANEEPARLARVLDCHPSDTPFRCAEMGASEAQRRGYREAVCMHSTHT